MIATRSARTPSSTKRTRCSSDFLALCLAYSGFPEIALTSWLGALSSKVKLLWQTAHVFKVLARIYHSTIASQARAYASLDSAIGRLPVVGQRKDFSLEDVQEVDEDYAFPNGISCAVNVVEGFQLLGKRRLAFKAKWLWRSESWPR